MIVEQVIKLVYRKDFSALQKAVAQGVDLNAVDDDGRTALIHAVLATEADSEMVRFLVTNGANPNVADAGQKWTALHFASRDQKLPVIQALLDSGSVVDVEDSFGNTPLWRCAMETNPKLEIVRLLLGKGADPCKKNRHGASPRDIAERTGKQELLALFGE